MQRPQQGHHPHNKRRESEASPTRNTPTAPSCVPSPHAVHSDAMPAAAATKDAKGNHSSAMGVCRPTSTTGGWERKIGRPSARVDSSHDRANSNPDHDRKGHIRLHHTYDHMLLEVA